jgi:hypothetical protein
MEGFAGLFLILCLAIIYFIPTLIACNRKHKQSTAIFVLNLFLGWLLIPWVCALVWSCTYQEKQNK